MPQEDKSRPSRLSINPASGSRLITKKEVGLIFNQIPVSFDRHPSPDESRYQSTSLLT